MAEIYVHAIFFSGVALGFSVFLPPALAGALAFFLSVLPSIMRDAVHDPRPLHRIPALIAYCVGPAAMPVDLMSDSFAKQRLHTEYGLYLAVLGENFFYALAILLVAAFIFRYREIRVR
jgi:hypothetical protein